MRLKTICRMDLLSIALSGLCLTAQGEWVDVADVTATCASSSTEVDTREEHDAYAALGGEGMEVVGDVDYTVDMTWAANKTWIVTGVVLVKGGTLTIEPGTRVLLGVGSGIRKDGGVIVSSGAVFGQLSEEQVLAFATAPGTKVDTREEHVAYAALGGDGVEVVGDVDYTGDMIWTADKTWIVTGVVLVKGGTLTIEPGTKVLLGVGSGIRQVGGMVVAAGASFEQLSEEQVLAFATAPGTEVDTREEHVAYAALGGEGVEVVGDLDIAGDVTWTADKTWIVTGIVLVKDGMLTIEPGAKVLLGVGSGIRQVGGTVVSSDAVFSPMSDMEIHAIATGKTVIDTCTDDTHYVAAGTEVELYGEDPWTAPDEAELYTLSHTDEFGEWFARYCVVGSSVVVVSDDDITSDVTWTSNKTWIVTGTVLVKGGKLTIEPGAKVLFGVGSGIRQVGGTVVADGVAFSNINFDGRMDYAEAEKGDVRLDTDVGGLRVAAKEEPLTFSTLWGESAAMQVKVSYATAYGEKADVVNEAGPAEGEYLWQANAPGYYTFTHVAGDETLSATFVVMDSKTTETVFERDITESTDWAKDKVILIDGIVTVKSGATLTIEPGAVVKFMDGAGIVCEAGGRCVADGVIFTHVNDDTVGGDTLLDGSTSPLSDMYVLDGVSGNDATQYRYHPDPTVTLSGTIAKNEVWRGFNIYHVTGSITVPNGVTLTIEPGAIIKFDTGLSLTVNSGATLNAIGTRAQPIVFTSIMDDEYGGDTNGDGNTELYPGEWAKIGVDGGTANFEHVKILYSSRNETTGAINMNGGKVVFNNGEIAHCAYDAVGVESGNFYMTNSVIRDSLLAFRHWARDPIVNCIIYDCGRLTQGGGQNFVNCIFSRITETWEAFGFPRNTTYRNCCFWNEGGSVLTGEGTQDAMTVCGKDGNIWGNPLFLDPDNGDFRLAEKSPCVDVGLASFAPETDYFGQPRVNAPDIGICEVMPRNVTSDIDLVPQSVTADAEAVSGQMLTINWTVANQGGADVDAEWRDTVSLVSENGRAITLGDKVNTRRLVAGGTISCSQSFIVPTIAEGKWYPKVNVNSARTVFEGALMENNALIGETAVNVSINSLSVAEATSRVMPGSSSVIYRLDGLPSAGGALVFSGDLAHLTFSNVANASNGVGMAGISLPDGRIVLPFDSGSDMQYLTVMNSSDQAAEFSVTVAEDTLQVMALSQMSVSNRGKTTIDIYGMGLTNVTSVALEGNGKRYAASSFSGKSYTEMYANFDANGWTAGTYDLVVSTADSMARIGNVTVFANGIGPKVTCSIEKPDAVRMGRWYTAKITCTNEGDEDAHVPMVTVIGSTETFLDPDNEVDEYKGSIRLLFLSHTGNPLVIKAGQSITVPVQFKSMASVSAFTFSLQCCILGRDKFMWDSFVVSDDKTMTELRRRYGDAPDALIEASLTEAALCTKFGVVPRCGDSFLLANIRRCLGKEIHVLCAEIACSDLECVKREVSCVSKNDKSVARGVFDDKGKAFFIVSGQDWVFLPKDGSGIYSIKSVLTNQAPFSVEIDYKRTAKNDEAIVTPEMRSFTKISNFCDIVDIGENNRILGWIDGLGSFILGKQAGSTIKIICTEQLKGGSYKSFRVQHDLWGGAFLLLHGEQNGQSVILKKAFEIVNGEFKWLESAKCLIEGRLSCPVLLTDDSISFIDELGRVVTATNLVFQNVILTESHLSRPRLSAVSFPAPASISIGKAPWCEFQGEVNVVNNTSQMKECCKWSNYQELLANGSATILGATFSPEIKVTAESVAICNGSKCSEPSELLYSHMQGGARLPVGYTPGKYMSLGEGVKELICQGLNHIEAAGDALARETSELLETVMGKGAIAYLRKVVRGKAESSVSGGIFLDFDQYYEGNFDNLKRDEVRGGVFLNGSMSYYVTLGMVRGRALTAEVNLDAGYSNLDGLYSDGSLTIRIGNYVKLECGIKSTLFGDLEPYGEWRVTILGGGNYSGNLEELHIGEILERNSYRLDQGWVSPNLSLDILNAGNSEKSDKIWIAPELLDSGLLDSRLIIQTYDGCGNSLQNILPVTGVAGYASAGDELVVSARNRDYETQSLYWFQWSNGKWQESLILDDIDNAIIRGVVQTTDGTVTVIEKMNENGGKDVVIVSNDDGTWKSRVIGSNVNGIVASVSCNDGNCLLVDILRTNEHGNDYIQQLSVEKFAVSSLELDISNQAISPMMAVPNRLSGDDVRLPQLLSANIRQSILSASSRDDGCAEDCFCECRFHFPCGCPQTCPCQGHCKEGEQCCDCTDKYGTLIHKSTDPNEIAGPLGVGDPETERFVKPGEWMTYTVYFENVSNATAAAQEVYVANPLSEWLDWCTFEMGEVAFGNQIDLGLSGKNGGTCEATMKGTNFVVRTWLSGDAKKDADIAKTGEAHWYLRIVDPTTKSGWPVDILAGFLPPNDETFRGEGHLTYRIKVRDDAPAGVVITNKASIVFDYNDPIETDPAWWNTVAPTTGNAKFNEAVVETEEGSNAVIRVTGGNAYSASSVKVYLTYNTAAAADLDLAKGTVDGTTPKGGLKFPLLLTWEKGEMGEKVITIPVKTDKTVEGDEFFTLQLAEAEGMELGEEWVCTVTIRDTTVAAGKETLQDAVNNAVVKMSTSGKGKWAYAAVGTGGEAAPGKTASASAMSPILKADEMSELKAAAVKGSGTLTFDVRVANPNLEGESPEAAEGAAKTVLTLLDGKAELLAWTNETDWTSASYTVEETKATSHAFTWRVVQGADTNAHAYVANVVWSPAGTEMRALTLAAASYIGGEPCDDPFAGGTVSGGGVYPNKTKLSLVATAKVGWEFVGWARGGGARGATALPDDGDGRAGRGLPAADGEILSNKAKWQVVVTNDEDYVAVFEKIPYVRGLADPADGGKVSGSALCPAGKKVTLKATTNKNFTFLGWRQGTGNGELGTGNGFVATTASLVIDRTAKPTANSKTSTTITNIAEDVTYYAVFKSYPEIFVTVDATDGTGAEPTGKGAGKYVAGTITGMGKYAIGKAKIALKAAANKGYVFAGWFDADSGLLTKNATYTVASMGENDVEYTARFVTADEDKASIALAVNGEEMRLAGDGSPHQKTNVWCGVYLEWPVAASALSETKVKVAGLPSGLKFTDKPVTSKIGSGKTAVMVTNVPANTIYGAPTAASKIDTKTGAAKPSVVKFTVTTAGKSTQTYQIDTIVDALPTWAQGTFAGGMTDGGQVSLTVSVAGKTSGKALGDGLTYTLAAPYYAGFELDDGVSNFISDVTTSWSYKDGSKTIKASEVVQLIVQDNGVGGYAAVEDWFEAYTVNWKVEPWKTLGKSFDKKTLTYAILADGTFSEDEDVLTSALGEEVVGRVTLKFAATGAVTVAGEFVTGYNEKTKKYTTVKATGSATLVPEDEDYGGVFIYLTPKGLAPHARCLNVPWPEE